MEEVTTILTGEDEERNGGFSERLTPHYQLALVIPREMGIVTQI
jgi:hypothetical protein